MAWSLEEQTIDLQQYFEDMSERHLYFFTGYLIAKIEK